MKDFIFDVSKKIYFGATSGVGSQVTEREGKKGGDKSVTVSKQEKQILYKYFKTFPRMSVTRARERGEKTEFEFKQYPHGSKITLSINHPKVMGDETRIYFKKGVFYPLPEDFWFIFEREKELWIGTLTEVEIGLVDDGVLLDTQNGFDQVNEDEYQQNLNNKPAPNRIPSVSMKYQRDPKIAQDALSRSGFVCEMMPKLETFTSRVSRKPYLEAHHFIPMMEQRHFEDSLDVVKNICILNPYAHKMVHHATYNEIGPYLKKLAEPREAFINEIGFSVDRVLKIYGGP